MASARRRRPSGVMPPLRLAPLLGAAVVVEALAPPPALASLSPRRAAHRARAAAASFARVAFDIRPRRPPPLRPAPAAREGVELVVDEPPPPPKSELSRSSSACICSRRDTASFNLFKDRSMSVSNFRVVRLQLTLFRINKLNGRKIIARRSPGLSIIALRRAVSSAVERLVYTELVGGSIPSLPTPPLPADFVSRRSQSQMRDRLLCRKCR